MQESFEESNNAVIAVVPAEPDTRTRPQRRDPERSPRREPNYHVVIWNDEEHSYEYVTEMLMRLFGYSQSKAYNITWEVDHAGRGIAYTTHKELAELKCEQILNYGADSTMSESKGSIRATIEPAPE